MHLHHERSMIGVQCQLMICRGHIRASKGAHGWVCGGWVGQWVNG